jgi:hypothetical protein
MDKKFGYYVFGGALIGAFLGLLWAGAGNQLAGLGGGTLIGTFIGWFAAAHAMEKAKKKN